jgi:hypothetical protein
VNVEVSCERACRRREVCERGVPAAAVEASSAKHFLWFLERTNAGRGANKLAVEAWLLKN